MQVARFHAERERLYRVADPDDRNAAFFKLHLDWYREWGLERVLLAVLKAFPLLRERLSVLAVRKSRGKQDEGAELYVNHREQRTALLALKLERYEDDAMLENYLWHEFMHLHDMLNPAFNYEPVLHLPGLNAAQRRLAVERYRLLWDITIDGRIFASGRLPMSPREQHAAAFAHSYHFWSEPRQTKTFQDLWQNRMTSHPRLVELIADPRGLRETHGPVPGGSCPLCDFPTYTWATSSGLAPWIQERIRAEFPGWAPEQGLCHRCLETYQALWTAAVHS